jgi:hypothetical protein
LVPVENSYLLAARIPGAQLRIVCGGGHLFLIDQAEELGGPEVLTSWAKATRVVITFSDPVAAREMTAM